MVTAEDIISEKGTDIFSVPPQTSIHDALQHMIEKKIGAILVSEGDELVGIWTERDLMRNTLQEGFDPKTAKIGDHMTTGLISAPYDAPVMQLASTFLGRRLRHLLIEREGKYIGLLSTGDIIKTSLQEKVEELEQLNQIVKLEYYEEWKWKKKRKR